MIYHGCGRHLKSKEMKNKTSIPKYISKFFWDVQKDAIDLEKHASFIIRRILEYGDHIALRWLKENYSDEDIKEIVYKKRGLSKKTLIYWQTYYKKEKCMKKF